MTGEVRELVRGLVDAQARARLAGTYCEHCCAPIRPPKLRFCCDAHRKYAWMLTPEGRAMLAARRRRGRADAARKRAAA